MDINKDQLTLVLQNLIFNLEKPTLVKIKTAIYTYHMFTNRKKAIDVLNNCTFNGEFESDNYAQDDGIFGAMQIVQHEGFTNLNSIANPLHVANELVRIRLNELLPIILVQFVNIKTIEINKRINKTISNIDKFLNER